MKLEDKVREEIVKLEKDVERNKRRITDFQMAIDADGRTIRSLKRILGLPTEVSVTPKQEVTSKRASLPTIIVNYARTHSNETINSDDVESHIVHIQGHPLGKGTLSTTLGKLVKEGFLKRTAGQKKFAYVIPKEVISNSGDSLEEIRKEEVPSTLVGTRMIILEALRSHANEGMKIPRILKVIKQKHPSLHVGRDVVWFHVNRGDLARTGLVKRVSYGTYQYKVPEEKELREDDCFAVGGD